MTPAAIASLVRLGADAVEGAAAGDVARSIVDVALSFASVADLRAHLDARAAAAADVAADAAEVAKFGTAG